MAKKTKIFILTTVALGLTTLSSVNTAKAEVIRQEGKNRYEIADKIVDSGWSTSTVAILTSGEDGNLVDALTVAPFAKLKDAPVILTPPGKTVSQTALAKLKKLGVKEVYIATGKGVIEDDAVKQLTSNGISTVKRLGGKNRYETALNIAKELGTVDRVVIASAENAHLVDSLSIASIAAIKGMPILLSDATKVGDDVKVYMGKMNIKTSYVMGGPTVLGDEILKDLPGNSKRIYGSDRYATNTITLKEFIEDEAVKYEKVYVTSGEDVDLIYPLVTAPLAAKNSSPILLAKEQVIEDSKKLLEGVTKSGSQFILVGDEKTVLPKVGTELTELQQMVVEKNIPLTVNGVTILNLKQIKVEFNKKIDRETATNSSYYMIYDNGNLRPLQDNHKITLEESGKSVLITIDPNSTTALTIVSNAKVVVKKGVRDTFGKEMEEDFTKNYISVTDGARPTITKVEQMAFNRIKVYFNEPVKDLSGGLAIGPENFWLDEGAYSITEVKEDLANAAVEISVSTGLQSGAHSLTVNPTEPCDLADFAGYKVNQGSSFTFTNKADSTAPAVTLKSLTQTSAVLKFSKAINNGKNSNIAYRHTQNDGTYQILGSSDNVSVNEDRTEVTVNFGAAGLQIPLGNVRIYVSYINEGNGNTFILDDFNNKVQPCYLFGEAKEDNVKPTAKAAVVPNSNTTIEVTYSKAVVGAENNENYELKDAYGATVPFGIAKSSASVYRLVTFAPMGGNYTLNIKGIKDTALLGNRMDGVTISVQVIDSIIPAFADELGKEDTSPKYYVQGDNKSVKIYFTKPINAADLMNVSMYQNTSDQNANPITALPITDSKAVSLTFANPVKNTLLVGQFRDLAGNRVKALATALASADGSVGVEPSKGNKVVAVTPVLIRIYANDSLTSLNPTDFEISKGGYNTWVTPVMCSMDKTNGKSVIDLTLAPYDALDKNQWDTTYPMVRTISSTGVQGPASNTKNIYGTKLNITAISITDLIAPELVGFSGISKLDVDGDGRVDHIKLAFTKTIASDSVTIDKFSVLNYVITDAYTSTTPPTSDTQRSGVHLQNAKEVYLTVFEKQDADLGENIKVNIGTGLKDMRGNAFVGSF